MQDRCIFNMNPFFSTYDTPHETVPFDKITINDFEPAIMKGIEEEDEVIDAIVNNPDTPTLENTIEALENSGELLSKVTEVFFNLLSAETTDEMDELAQKLSPILSEHGNNITLNEKLFERVKAVYENVDKNSLTKEQQRLLQDSYDSFVRNGANLNEEDKQKYRQLTSELGVLSLQFSQNKLKDLNAFTLHITDEAELEGLPESAIDAAKEEAKSRNLEGWVFTLQAPSYGPFLTYSAKRELRKQMYMAYNTICTHDNENNNLDIVKQIVNHHREIAQLLGYKTYADYTLVKRMAQNSETVYNLLIQLLEAYKPTAKKEVEEVRKMAKEMTGDEQFELQPWDFGYYSNKLKERDYNINSEMLRPYFELSKVKKGVFGLATKLYGISFKLNKDIPVYHPDVEAYEVFDKDGKYLAVLYCDFHPRKSKKSGAWMTSYKEQWIDKNGVNSRPHVSVTMNLTKPTTEKPSLLTLGEVETFLHEFGHSLHGMFANTKYKSLSGTNVYWDFVELPSQFMENYAVEKDFLNTFAFHYQTGEPLPDELIQRIVKSRNFNVAYACLRQLSFGLLDMAYYTKETEFDDDVKEFEKSAWKETQLLPQVPEACMSVQFSHIMAGGYSAGYYSYKWAEVLDADAFSLFKENGIFDSATAQRFRENVLSKGGTEPPMDLYIRFRGQKPSIDALLKRNGIVKSESRI
ncbi:MAG: M3 family metallopeptidase [Bacteroidaceae bacterium]|nr:M3 family metallopeptidase [Bacteroidaceae bacterium]